MNQRNILITGAAGNLGTAICQKFIDLGYQVIGTLAPGEKGSNPQVDYHECNLMDENATHSLFEELQKKYTHLDAAICLVGGFGMASITQASSGDMMKMLQLNYMTAFHTAHFSTGWMNEGTGGRMVFVGAKPALEGGASQVLPYAVSKSAVIKLAEIINEDTELNNIQAAVIAPSVIDTPPNREAMPEANFDDWVKPEVIADNIAFIISETASIIRNPILKLYNNA